MATVAGKGGTAVIEDGRNMVTVEVVDPSGLMRRRRELLDKVRMDERSLRRAAAEYRLDDEQTAILDELDRIDFLVGN